MSQSTPSPGRTSNGSAHENEHTNTFLYWNNAFRMLMHVYDVFYVLYDTTYIVITNGNSIFWRHFVIERNIKGKLYIVQNVCKENKWKTTYIWKNCNSFFFYGKQIIRMAYM